LCLPIIRQNKVIGALYLENRLTTHSFTSGRVAVLDVLASQAAISLENARLYSDLGRSEALLSEAQQLSLIGSFLWNVTNDRITWSKQTHRIFEIDQSIQVTFELTMSRVHPEDAPAFRQFLDFARTKSGDMNYEFRLLLPNVSVKHLRLVAHATQNLNGELEYIGAIQDVTERWASEEALNKARSDLARVSRVATLGELTASIAHEVNQPLGAAINNASACLNLIPSGNPESDEIREALKEIIQGADRASAVIARVRRLSTNVPYERLPVNLGDVATDVLALTRHEAASRRVTVRTSLADDLPPVFGDRVQLQQVLLNLVVNGMDAMSATDVSGRILTISGMRETRDRKPGCLITVKDAGTGFKPDDAERLFEAFYTTKPHGMGMGLAISRSIIEAHGGRMWAERNDGLGATFLFSLPV
jgi:signal transduction histidine kinase